MKEKILEMRVSFSISIPLAILSDSFYDLQELHSGVYQGFSAYKQLPTQYGIRNLWQVPSLNVSYYFGIYPNITKTYRTLTLWDLGNIFMEKAQNVLTKANLNRNSTNASAIFDLQTLSDFYIVMVRLS